MAVNINILNAGNMTLGSASDPRKTKITFADGHVEEYIIPDDSSWDFFREHTNANITEIDIGNTITGIGSDTFMDYSTLVSVTIPNSVTYIGGYAFEDCSNLTNVTIGSGVNSID